MNPRIDGYAKAMLEVAKAEGNVKGINDEVFAVARAVESSDELRQVLSDIHIPAEKRQEVVQSILEGKAMPATIGLVSMVVGAGRGGDLPKIANSLAEISAAEESKEVATVRAAVPLTEDQLQRLAVALKTSTGKDVDIRVIHDPSVVGGVITTIGDTVIDGSVRSRLTRLRETL